MFRQNKTFSYSPSYRGYSQDDFPQRRPFQQDDYKVDYRGSAAQRNNMFRPNGKSIYMQRREYSETLTREAETHFRVEHLLTCELDGRELKTLDNCMAKLKRLDGKGRLWPQHMIMEVHRGYLVLSDIETKAELEAIPMRWVLESKAVLDACAYNSVLTITVDERNKRCPQVYMFQCEETGAEDIKTDLDKLLDYRGGLADDDGSVDVRTAQPDIKINLENIIGKHFRQPDSYIMPREKSPLPLPDFPPPQWSEAEMPPPPPQQYGSQYDYVASPTFQVPRSAVPTPVQIDGDSNTEIFNHVLDDVEIFMNKISKATLAQGGSSQKKRNKRRSRNALANSLPTVEEYIFILQKIKYGFNLLAQLEGVLSTPSPADFVHMLFDGLAMVVPLYRADVPPSVVSPLLTEGALQLLGQTTRTEEKNLWASLGDSWNIPRSNWPEDILPYVPEFYDGWQPPPAPAPPPYQNYSSEQIARSNNQRFSPGRPEQPARDEPWNSQPPRSSEPPLYARAIYDFRAGSNRELSISKGDLVQVVKRSSYWWLVRSRGEEGSVPQNVLELVSSGPAEDQQWNPRGAVTLDMNSTATEVKAWLEYKGFSRITVNTLGVLTGKLLLGMTKEEIRTVCPEEGSKVFFHLQSVKSAMALASEQTSGRRY